GRKWMCCCSMTKTPTRRPWRARRRHAPTAGSAYGRRRRSRPVWHTGAWYGYGERGRGHMLNVALPKGRLGEKVYRLFDAAGLSCPDFFDDHRKLVLEGAGARYFLIKPSDVGIYVERGAADIGVVGRDVLLETEPDVYELLDLKLGRCRLAVA